MTRTVAASLCLVALFTASLSGRSKSSATRLDQDYVAALATADRFLHAWQTQDEEAGILMLTDRVRHHTQESALQIFFSAQVSASQSYEIGRGKRLGRGRYEFPISLFQRASGDDRNWMHPQASVLVVVKAGSDWAVDKLP